MACSVDRVRRRHRICGAMVGAYLLATGSQAVLFARQSGARVPVPVSPIRNQAAVPPGPPPALPAEATKLAPATIEMQISTGAGLRRQVVTRTVDRVHVSAGPEREWLYQRNPTDARRVSGFLIDHPQHVIVRYDESDLRNNFGIRGWIDVLTMGFDSGALEGMGTTRDRRFINGLPCEPYVAERPEAVVREVCWSRQDLLPVEVRGRGADGTTKVNVSVLSVRRTVQNGLMAEPSARFPGYRIIDLPDWLEGLEAR